ncbi:hypothetical protein NE237_023835 [Protea cynaroides]|uniref:NAD-dependent epimerase/dehydratase domain-containing protein n=1 Tax=Protea cynaroides TaxID=273540 RepID=A0A9Q0HER1_9MAGN|nr:hypothetical protein NE237_023835 [Protea cynaroides]
MAEKGIVCVTGAGGYVASWLVKLLLSKGYRVHGTVRDPGDAKNAHLKKLDNALEYLQLFKADLLDYGSLNAAIAGCDGVFHTASPVPPGTVQNPEVELIEPAVTGTLNVLKACSEAKVKRVVVVSSVAAVSLNPNWPKNQIMDEICWSDKEYCRETKNFYCLSKTLAESEAWEYAKRSGLDMVTICPTLVVGPMLQSTLNASSQPILKLVKGLESVENRIWKIVDVRDVAEALLLVYEKLEAEGRYICCAHMIKTKELVDKLRSLFPNYNYPKNFIEAADEGAKVSWEKLLQLGWKYRPLEETLVDTVKSYQESGPFPTPGPSSTTAGPPIFAPSWRVHSTDSGLQNRVVAREVIHHTWLPSDAQTLRPVSLEVLDRDQSAAIYQLICGSNHYHRMLSTALDKLLGVQAAALESERLMVAAQNERDAAVAAKA